MQNFKKNVNGITLMALVITIIILLILAGISVGMLSGNNSIINQAGNAKTQTDIAQEKEILEQATVVAMGKSKYGNVEKQYLDPKLNKYSEIDSTEEVDEGIQVTFKSSRNYLVDADGNVTTYVPPISIATLESMYGQEVIGYPTQNGVEGWQLFYADKENKEVFIISRNTIELSTAIGSTRIPIKPNKSDTEYNLSDFENPELIYAKNYNSKWLNLATTTYNKTRAVAYLCDYNNWNEKYKSGSAKYAIGGPTLEMFVASYYKVQVKNLNIDGVVTAGYPITINSTLPIGLYRPKNVSYWIASPSTQAGNKLLNVYHDGSIHDSAEYDYIFNVRPMICLSQSAIQLLDNGTLTIISD